MTGILQEERFDFVSKKDKAFIHAFDGEMTRLGYDFGSQIGSGYCWGRFMMIYRKVGVKSQNVYARIYMRDSDIVLRLFFNNIDKHRPFIEKALPHIKEVFTGMYGRCRHCHNEKEGQCRFRKTYTIDGELIEKCNGDTFYFFNPSLDALKDYIALFTEFYPVRKSKNR